MIKNEFPSSWRIVELRDITTLIGGGTPSRKHRDFFQGDIAWVTGADFAEYELTLLDEAREYITEKAIEASATTLVDKNSILITTRVNVGKVAIAQAPLCFSQDITALVIKNPHLVIPEYLAYLLFANRESILRFDRGTTISGIRRNDLARFSVPLPTLLEQREIVKILRQADYLRQLRTQADNQSELLALATFNQIFGFIDKNSSYRQVKLEKISEIVSGVTKGRNLPSHETVNVPYMRVANVQAGYLDLSEIKTIDVLPSDVEKYTLQSGDVLLTEGGDFDKLGRGAIWEHDIPECIHQNHVFRVRLDQSILLPMFFHYYLQSAYARHYFLRAAKRTTNLASINITQLGALPVPIPSMAMQERFITAVNQIRTVLTVQADTGTEIEQLAQAAMIYAFTGQLTQSFREQNNVVLEQLALDRDTALKSPTHAAELQLPETAQAIERLTARNSLSSAQQNLLNTIENQDAYVTGNYEEISGDLTPNEVSRDLDLLKQMGLIKAVSISVTPGQLGRIFFTKAYRALGSEDDVRDIDLAILREAQEE